MRSDLMLKSITERSREVRDFVEKEGGHVIDYICKNLNASESEREVLERRVAAIQDITLVDPLLGAITKVAGDWNTQSRTMRLDGIEKNMNMNVVHELLHSMSSVAYSLTEIDIPLEEGDEQPYDTTAERIGIRFMNRFGFLNEGVTQTWTRNFLAGYSAQLKRTTEKEAWKIYLEAANAAYPEEQDMITWIHEPSSLPPEYARPGQMTEAVDRATAAGAILSVHEFDALLSRAYFFDEVTDDGHGRADHWRTWSAKIRECYGDGILVAIDKPWKQSRKAKVDPIEPCLKLLTERFLAKWAP